MRWERVTFLCASLCLFLGISDSMWGQNGVLLPQYQTNSDTERITLRRGDANTPGSVGYIGGGTNVNNEFGAGESSTITGGAVTWPAANGMHTPPSAIQLGSEYSQNIVINTYNAGGYASGVVSLRLVGVVNNQTRNVNTGSVTAAGIHDFTSGTYPGWTFANRHLIDWGYGLLGVAGTNNAIAGSQQQRIGDLVVNGTSSTSLTMTPSISHGSVNMGAADGVYAAGSLSTDIASAGGSYTQHIVDVFLVNHVYTGTNTGMAGHWQTRATSGNTPYTSTVSGGLDDGVLLFQEDGATGTAPGNNIGSAPTKANGVLDPYIRPTTVAVAGTNMFDNITFKNLQWWYRWHSLGTFPAAQGGLWYTQTSESADQKSFLANGCGCHTGIYWRSTAVTGDWDYMTEVGNTLVDAAVQILNGATVCVIGDVMDVTGSIGNKANTGDGTYQNTNALITVPVNDRFTLRTKGDFMANMYHEASSAANVFYTAASFPDPDADITLAQSGTAQNIGGSLRSFANNKYTSVASAAPYTSTASSIFGVYGDYLFAGNMAKIHTDNTSNDNFQGVIEVGERTAGKAYFNISSNGMLKNYEGCNITDNFPMHFGEDGMLQYGGTPNLQITTDEALHIVNFGNLATLKNAAELRFHTTSVDSINNAFGGSGAGALQIQALSHVRLNANGSWDATANGNNIFILSDGGNISTQELEISSDYKNTVGQGLITIWAETDGLFTNTATNRFSAAGNIYMNDNVSITRAAADPTQTTIIAENNIRTASFTSINADDDDTTNIISRKGDIYLGYSAGVNVYSGTGAAEGIAPNGRTGNMNVFTYNGTGPTGILNILAGYDDDVDNGLRHEGGNIYITRLNVDNSAGTAHATNVMIPFSNEYRCTVDGRLHERLNGTGISMQHYEHAGIILGVGRCGIENALGSYAGMLENQTTNAVNITVNSNTAPVPSLVYSADGGELIYDTGLRGNIINNTGAEMKFNTSNSNAFFRTRSGDIDMRGETNVDGLSATNGLVFLADNGIANKALIDCDCEEESNNVYLQDFDFEGFATSTANDGSVYFGADNNIKLQYGGLKDRGTWKDPFLSENAGYAGGGLLCSSNYHCDSDPSVNKARAMILDYTGKANGGGVGVVASDLIDVYKSLIYIGGASGLGMSPVPAKTATLNGITSPGGLLHGENVAGYGLYIKTQANKKNWNLNPFDLLDNCDKKCPTGTCNDAYLHQIARVTFHDDARILPENSKAYIGSPVLDVYGVLELNTTAGTGSKPNQLLHIQTDSLIVHDSLIIDGNRLHLTTWSNLYRDMPVIKLGHQQIGRASCRERV